MTSIAASVAARPDLQAFRSQIQQEVFSRLGGGQGSINIQQWQQALQNLPRAVGSGPANNAGVVGTGTASAVDAAFKSIDANGDGHLSQTEFGVAMDKMLDRARHRHRQGAGDTALDAQLLGQQQPSGGVVAPDFLRRMVLGYGASAS